jgi:hypothetical protein
VTQGLGAALQAAVAGDPAARITLGELVEALQARGYGLLLFLFAVPNLTPGPSLPGFSTIFAVPLALVAIQMALGVAHPRLPGFLARLGFSRGRAQRVVAAAAPLLARGEKLLRPRGAMLTGPAARRWIGFAALLQAVLLLIPLPLLPLIPSLALVVLALGLAAHDGAAVGIGLAACALAAILFGLALFYGAALLGLA